jgi:uncharacterized OsmC-like protein
MTQDTITQEKIVNGVNVDQLASIVEGYKEEPELAKFKFRATNEWVDGTHNRATIADYYGDGEEHTSREARVFDVDEPPDFLGNDKGPGPVEYLLIALSGCLTTSLIANASVKGIEIKGLQSRLEGDLDLRGFLQISEEVKVGYERIRVYFTIDADISDEEKEELVQLAQRDSVILHTITETAPVSVQLDK